MNDEKFTINDAADLFGDDEPDEDIDLDLDSEPEFEVRAVIVAKIESEHTEAEEDLDLDDLIMEIKEKALEMVKKCGNIYKLTLQGRLEGKFPRVDKRVIGKAVNSLKNHPEVNWPHDLMLQKV